MWNCIVWMCRACREVLAARATICLLHSCLSVARNEKEVEWQHLMKDGQAGNGPTCSPHPNLTDVMGKGSQWQCWEAWWVERRVPEETSVWLPTLHPCSSDDDPPAAHPNNWSLASLTMAPHGAAATEVSWTKLKVLQCPTSSVASAQISYAFMLEAQGISYADFC